MALIISVSIITILFQVFVIFMILILPMCDLFQGGVEVIGTLERPNVSRFYRVRVYYFIYIHPQICLSHLLNLML